MLPGGGSVHHLESQYDSQVSTVSNTPDTSHTDHVTDFNNKFRFGLIKRIPLSLLLHKSFFD